MVTKIAPDRIPHRPPPPPKFRYSSSYRSRDLRGGGAGPTHPSTARNSQTPSTAGVKVLIQRVVWIIKRNSFQSLQGGLRSLHGVFGVKCLSNNIAKSFSWKCGTGKDRPCVPAKLSAYNQVAQAPDDAGVMLAERPHAVEWECVASSSFDVNIELLCVWRSTGKIQWTTPADHTMHEKIGQVAPRMKGGGAARARERFHPHFERLIQVGICYIG